MMTISSVLNDIVAVEGGYSNHPSDLGGETKYGITVRVARKHGYTGPMIDMTREQAKAIYLAEFIVDPGFDKVFAISKPIGAELIDTGVNMGVSHPCLWLQRCLNAFNRQGELYADIRVDGDVGPATLTALRGYLTSRGHLAETVMLRALNSLQGERYLSISEAREKNEDFTFGWFANRVQIA